MFKFLKKTANQNKQGARQPIPGPLSESAKIRAQALENARLARENIGDETLQKLAAAIQKKQASAHERNKAVIAQSDPERVAEEILAMLERR